MIGAASNFHHRIGISSQMQPQTWYILVCVSHISLLLLGRKLRRFWQNQGLRADPSVRELWQNCPPSLIPWRGRFPPQKSADVGIYVAQSTWFAALTHQVAPHPPFCVDADFLPCLATLWDSPSGEGGPPTRTREETGLPLN
jgi:hypothetical protein